MEPLYLMFVWREFLDPTTSLLFIYSREIESHTCVHTHTHTHTGMYVCVCVCVSVCVCAPMKILSFNCRGVAIPSKKLPMRRLVEAH
jgi:hypothetical protein